MNGSTDTPTPYMKWVKSQADVLVPLLRHLRAELGVERANELVYPVLREYMKEWIVEFASKESDNPIVNFYKTSDRLEATFEGDVEYSVLKHDDEKFDLNVTSCKYAEFFRQLDEPELGAILVCEADNHIADLSAPNVEFSRTDTIMKGGACCPFRYRFYHQEKVINGPEGLLTSRSAEHP
ncbi:MAG: L-2-amino-thiazoline-4-carboxylic acid hydrolase [Rhizobiales bacterium]|nr:L-2-amino-thiazoline-4-carboxylic acid hydrolase [Hyphomicrobiales bacterium]